MRADERPLVLFEQLDGDQAAAILDELSGLYREVYAEPPYEWGEEHAVLFRERFAEQRRAPGFALVAARVGGELVGVRVRGDVAAVYAVVAELGGAATGDRDARVAGPDAGGGGAAGARTVASAARGATSA
jgi:hypothetical protein